LRNQYIAQRLDGIRQMLIGARNAGAGGSSATKGRDRELFVESFLSAVLPPSFRFGSGDVTDQLGNKSGQLDVVVEFPFLPSLPIVGTASSRLYLAEGVAAALEVKSDISAQWHDVRHTANCLAKLERRFGAQVIMGGPGPGQRIPLFAAGYSGWSNSETVRQKLTEGPLDGILVIDPGIFVSTPEFSSLTATGEWALWGLITCLHRSASALKATSANPLMYAINEPT
jgi:hypothetical protein